MESLREQNIPLDVDELSARCLGRIDLVRKVLERFQQSMDQELVQLERALDTEDMGALAGISHRIRGTSLTVSARGLEDRAQRLETAVTSGRLDGIEACIAAIKSEWVRLSDHISNSASRSPE